MLVVNTLWKCALDPNMLTNRSSRRLEQGEQKVFSNDIKWNVIVLVIIQRDPPNVDSRRLSGQEC